MGRIEDEIKQKKFENEWRKAFINLSFSYHHFNNLTSKAIKSKKITAQQYNVLRILRGAHPEAKRVGDIKAVMIDKNPDLTRLLDRLLTKAYIVRENCSEDRRQVNVKITNEGLDLLKIIDKELEGWDDHIKTITEEEAKELNRILDKWRD